MQIPLGGTATGTGLNTHPEFAAKVRERLGLGEAPLDPFEAQGNRDGLVELHGAMKGVAVSLTKIAQDLVLMGSGPRTGFAELRLPELQKGSSIMPGKVNPVIPEVVLQVAAQVIGNDTAVTVAGTQGNFELNVRVPMMARNVFDSIRLLTAASRLLAEKCVDGLEPNEENLRRHAESTPAIATALNPYIGYDLGTEIVNEAVASPRTIREVAIEKGVDEETLDKALDLHAMARGSKPSIAPAGVHRHERLRLAGAGQVLRPAGVQLARAVANERLADRARPSGDSAAGPTRPGRHRLQQIRHRVDRRRVLAQLEVEVRPGRVAGRSHETKPCAPRHLLAHKRRDRGQVRVPRGVSEPVADHHEVAVATPVPARELRNTNARGADRRAGLGGEVDPRVGAATLPAGAEAITDRTGHRTQESHRPVRHRRGPSGC